MKLSNALTALILSISVLYAQAQEAPKGYKKGSVTLADGNSLSGFVKDNLRSNAAVSFITDASAKKKSYSGHELTAATIEDASCLCISGDFFRIISNGKMNFLQKAS